MIGAYQVQVVSEVTVLTCPTLNLQSVQFEVDNDVNIDLTGCPINQALA